MGHVTGVTGVMRITKVFVTEFQLSHTHTHTLGYSQLEHFEFQNSRFREHFRMMMKFSMHKNVSVEILNPYKIHTFSFNSWNFIYFRPYIRTTWYFIPIRFRVLSTDLLWFILFIWQWPVGMNIWVSNFYPSYSYDFGSKLFVRIFSLHIRNTRFWIICI